MIELSPDAERDRELEALVGRTIAEKYVVRKLLGRGGMGAVYEAEHIELGKKVALKFIFREHAKDEVVSSRFAREARAASAIESAHIVSVFDTGSDDGHPFIVMELLRGEDLGSKLQREGRLGVADAIHITAQILRGLVRAHEAGIIHRDLKPDNVFLVETDVDRTFVKIVDFGISKMHREGKNDTRELALTGRGTVLGTPFYMSPEQAQGLTDVDERTDLYSVGAILFECLTGRPPHTGETYEQVIVSIVTKDPPDLRSIAPDASKELSQFVARALDRDRSQRYTSARRMLLTLHDLAPDEKKRVPIDAGATDTLVSALALRVNANEDDARERKVPRTDVSWSQHAGAQVEARSTPPERPRRSRVPLFAGGAAILGVFAMALVLTLASPSPHVVTAPSADMSSTRVTGSAGASSGDRVGAIAPPSSAKVDDDRASPREESSVAPPMSATLVSDPPSEQPRTNVVRTGPRSNGPTAPKLPASASKRQGLGQGLELNREMPP